jgi:phosphohistidine phosphatase
MKILLLIRHAQSLQSSPEADFNRTLTEQGRRDAARMARLVKDKKMAPDALVTSAAKRAQETAVAMAAVWNYDPGRIRLEKDLYQSSFLGYDQIIGSVGDSCDRLALVGHNPVISRFVNSLTSFSSDFFPPCSVAAFRIHTKLWNDFQLAEKEFLFLEMPGEDRR